MDHKHESDDMDHITKAEGERILERLRVAMEPVPRDEELWAWLEEEDKDGYTDGDYLREAEIAIQVVCIPGSRIL
jgi:succinate dehydrogenase/fumarate reductase flavoprotein subunit